MLWFSDETTTSGNKFWRWLRRHLLLVLQALALAALILSLARPQHVVSTESRHDLVLVIDGSGRTAIPDETGTSFDRTKNAAWSHITAVATQATVSIIIAKALPQIVVVRETNPEKIRHVLHELEPGYGPADIEAALEIAQSILRDGPKGSVAIVSDGRFTIDESRLLANAGLIKLPPESSKLLIDGITTRRQPSGRMQALVRVTSTFMAARQVEVTLSVDGTEIASQIIRVPGNGWFGAIFSEFGEHPPTDITARLGEDSTAQHAITTVSPSSSILNPIRAAVVSDNPDPYIHALEVLPNVIVQHVDPLSYAPEPRFDLYLFAGFVPEVLPRASMLFFGPPPDTSLFEIAPAVSRSLPIGVKASVLLEFVDLSFLEPGESNSVSLPDWSQPDLLLDTGATILHGIFEGRRTIVVALDPVESGMTEIPAFPIFMINAVNWANPLRTLSQEGPIAIGQELYAHPHPQATEIHVGKSGTSSLRKFDTSKPIVLGPFQETGLYQIRQVSDGITFGVEEFIVAPSSFGDTSQNPIISLGPPPDLNPPESGTQTVHSDFWLWLTLAALIVMGGEWLWFHKVGATA